MAIYTSAISASSHITSSGTISSTRAPGANNADPTVAFGDGDTGFYERSDDDLRMSIGGSGIWEFSSNCLGSVNEGRAHFNNETATATNPSIIPWRNDADTGIGRGSANVLSLIAGGVEALSLSSSTATFAGKILAGTGATAAATINAYTTTVSSNLYSALRVIENSGASSYWDIGATGGSNTLLNFYHNATTTPKISFTHEGGATFAGHITASGNISSSGTITANSFVGSFTGGVTGDATGLTGTPDISVGHITASGNISASGAIDGASLDINGAADISGTLNVGTGPSRFTHQQNSGSRLELYNNRQDLGNVEVYRIAAYNSTEVAGIHFYRGGGGNSGYTKIFAKKSNASSLEEVVQFGTNDALTTTFAGDVTVGGTGSFSDGRFTGNVGIGTTTPSEKLEVAGKAIIRKSGTATAHGDTDLLVTDATAGGSTAQVQILGGATGYSHLYLSDTGGYNRGGLSYAHSTDTLSIKAAATTAITITGSNQNVGIGTTSPSNKLTVEDTIGVKRSGVAAITTLQQTGTGLILNAPSGYHPLTIQYNGTEQVRFTNSGNVGIGTSTPTEALQVTGNISASGTVTIDANSPNSKLHVGNATGNSGKALTLENSPSGRFQAFGFDGSNSFYTAYAPTFIIGYGESTGAKPTVETIKINQAGTVEFLSDITVGNHITASGNISSSGNIYADKFYLHGSKETYMGSLDSGDDISLVAVDDIRLKPADDLTIYHGATQYARFDGGNRALEITGDITATGTITAQEFHTEFISASVIFESGSTKFGDSSDDIHSITGSLNLTGSLDINNTAGSTAQAIFRGGSSLNSDYRSGQILIGGSNNVRGSLAWNNGLAGVYLDNQYDSTVGFIAFRTRTSGTPVEGMRILGGGNVHINNNLGIGTTTPTEALQVTGDISASGDVHLQHLQFDHYSNDIFFGTDSSANKLSYNEWKQSASGGTTINNIAGTINFDSKGQADTMVVSGSNVGIGTTAPGEKLEVIGSVKMTNAIFTVVSDGGNFININHTGNESWTFDAQSGAGADDYISVGISGGTRAMSWHEDGKVGIGTTTPSEKLTVIGNISASGAILTNNTGSASEPAFGFKTNSGFTGIFSANGTDRMDISIGGTSEMVLDSSRVRFGQSSAAPVVEYEAQTGGPSFTYEDDADTGIGRTAVDSLGIYAGGKIIDITSTGASITGDAYISGALQVTGSIVAYNPGGTSRIAVGENTNFDFNHLIMESDGASNKSDFYTVGTGNHMEISTKNVADIILSSNKNLYFKTDNGTTLGGGTTRMFITGSSGYVGIGTTSPSTKLHVYNGEATIASSTDGIKINYSAGNSSGVIDTAFADNNLEFRTNGSTRMFITGSTGNVGIGTTTPAAKLEIKGSGASTGLTFKTTDSSGNTGFWTQDGGATGVHYYPFVVGMDHDDTKPSSTLFYTKTAVGTEGGLFVKTDGKVGIGTTAPTEALQVTGNISSSGAINTLSHITASGDISASGTITTDKFKANLEAGVDNSVLIKDADGFIKTDEINSNVWGSDTILNAAGLTTGYIPVSDNGNQMDDSNLYWASDKLGIGIGAVTPPEALTVTGNISASGTGSFSDGRFTGKVGIGTALPSGELHVSNTSDFYTDLDGTDSAVVFKESGGNPWRIGNKDSDDSFRITQNATSLNTSTRFTIANGGNVGIGTTTPTEKLTVTGNISASGTVHANQLQLNNYLHWGTTAGDNGYIFDDGTKLQIGYNDSDIISVHDTGENVFIDGNTRIAGHITASGDISASGTIHSAGGTMSDFIKFDSGKGLQFVDANQNINGSTNAITIESDDYLVINADTDVSITSPLVKTSGNISASGTVYGAVVQTPRINGVGGEVFVADNIRTTGISASGNISASGTITTTTLTATAGTVGGSAILTVGNYAAQDYSSITAGEAANADTATNATTATLAASITATANNSTNETTYLTFVDGATGTQGIETDTALKYNPGTNGVTLGQITASSDISSSGNIIGKTSKIGIRDFDWAYSATHIASTTSVQGDIIYHETATATTAGTIYYLNTSGVVVLSNADAVASSFGLLVVALGSNASLGLLLRGVVQLKVNPYSTIGSPVYLSKTAGRGHSAAPSGSGDVVRVVGHQLSSNAASGNSIYFNPDNTWVEVS